MRLSRYRLVTFIRSSTSYESLRRELAGSQKPSVGFASRGLGVCALKAIGFIVPLIRILALASGCLWSGPGALAQASVPAKSSAVLIELFTSEGCSDCPPADELLRQAVGRTTADGQLVVGISEHVDYWDRLGWRDPFSAHQYSDRQNAYGMRFDLDSVYTPQMIVNGKEQFVGSDRRALQAALSREAQRKQINLHITSVYISDNKLTFNYSASELPPKGRIQLVAALVDDEDRSHVLHGENLGRQLVHVSVARAMTSLGALHETAQQSVSLHLPESFSGSGRGHHLVLFAQEDGFGAVVGVDTKAL